MIPRSEPSPKFRLESGIADMPPLGIRFVANTSVNQNEALRFDKEESPVRFRLSVRQSLVCAVSRPKERLPPQCRSTAARRPERT